MIKILKKEIKEIQVLLRNIPALFFALFVLAAIAMNLLANKSISLPVDWLALDSGIIFSWLAFLTMDVLTKHFGPKASTQVSIVVALINLLTCLLFFIASIIPGVWSATGSDQAINDIINNALDSTFRGIWYVLFGSTLAFILSSLVNNFSNFALGKIFKKENYRSYFARSMISTMLGQFVDNFTFAIIVSHVFFGWTLLQCFMCAVTGMVVELLFELVFLPIGYKICKEWRKNNVGDEYFAYIKGDIK